MDAATVKQLVLQLATKTGRYRPFTVAEQRLVQKEAVRFWGDVPSGAGSDPCQYRLEFLEPRPLQTHLENLLYTPTGMAWRQGTLDQRYSLRQPALKDLWSRPVPVKTLPVGVIVQAETPYTYGDWVSEHLVCLSQALPLAAPLLLPANLCDRPYVLRDLERLEIDFVPVEQPVQLQQAIVLHKTRFSHYWTKAEAMACRQALRIQPVTPRPGSMIYLSRAGEVSAARQRSYPSELAAEILAELGAKIVIARDTSYEDYLALAPLAETVIADHGAAMNNLLLWNTQTIIELFSDAWWTSCFLFLGHALGVQNHVLLRGNDCSKQELQQQLTHYLDQFCRV
jgi:Glycosyltransferase 61